jgi:hypothetical protein
MNHKPFADHCSNPGRNDYWTCPACYHDLGNVGCGRHTCPECQTEIDCTLEYEPACHSRVAED